MSSIWHTKKEKPTEDKTVFARHKSFRDGTIECFIWEKQEFTDAIRKDVIAWAYLDDLLALETELERTRKALNHCIKIFHQLEDVLDEKASSRDFDDPDLYAWAVQIKPIWLELKEITGIDYKTAPEQKDK